MGMTIAEKIIAAAAGVDSVKPGDIMELHMSDGTAVANGKTYTCTKLPEYMQGILNQGGLIASLNKEEK